jgi:hypothetical protein
MKDENTNFTGLGQEDKGETHKFSTSSFLGLRWWLLSFHVVKIYAATRVNIVRRFSIGPMWPRIISSGLVLQPRHRAVPSNQLQSGCRRWQWIIRCSSVSRSFWQNWQFKSMVESYRWHLVLVGSSRWLNRNKVSLMLVGRTAVSTQIFFQSRLGLRISIFPGLLTSWIQWR